MSRFQTWAKWFIACEATALVLALLIVCGIIPKWGCWYSADVIYREQTTAILHGRLALSNTPAALDFDLAWSQNGVQQVWGLGIPLWRLPFEVVARFFGQSGFPDQLAFGIACWIVAYFVLKQWLPLQFFDDSVGKEKGVSNSMISGIGVAFLFLCFPPFVNLLRTPNVGALAYVYIYGIGLVTGLIAFFRKPAWWKYWMLCSLAGLGGLVRPTLFFYGIVTLFLAGWVALQYQKKHLRLSLTGNILSQLKSWQLWLGPTLFIIGGGILFFTNLFRFGNGFEFGHKLNVQNDDLLGNIYATRFDYPFENEPFLSSARELFGALFFVNHLNGLDWYCSNIFWGQSPTIRWRNFYFSTYDLSFVVLILLGSMALALTVTRSLFKKMDMRTVTVYSTENILIGLWSLGGALLLAIFYLHVPALSSRYMLDFAPAIAGIIAVFWLRLVRFSLRYWEHNIASFSLLFILFGWMGFEIDQAHFSYHSFSCSATWEDVVEKMQIPDGTVSLPAANYRKGFDFNQTGIPFNGTGWEADGTTAPAVILFVKDPQFIKLEITDDSKKNRDNSPLVRAKVGLEFLKEESCKKTTNSWLVKFSAPTRPLYQHGIQPLFLAFGPKEELAKIKTNYHLLDVSWKFENSSEK